MPDGFIVTAIKSLVLVNLVMVMFAFMTWFERRLIGRFQVRLGPNRVGPFGLLQPIADLGKLIQKESLIPLGSSTVPVPGGAGDLAVQRADGVLGGAVRRTRPRSPAPTTRSTCGSPIPTSPCCWCSRSARSASTGSWWAAGRPAPSTRCTARCAPSSQLVSYEVSLALAVIGVVMMSQTLSLTGIVEAQQRDGIWYIVPAVRRLRDLPAGIDRRGQPHPVRPAGGRGRAGGRLPHRVRRHALGDVPERRVRRA